MVISCCAYGCHQRFIKGSPITFHGFPKNPVRSKLWIAAMRRKDFIPNKYSKLCSQHFTEDSFDDEKFGGHWLRNTAVPTLFNFPPHPMKNQKLINSPKKRALSPENTENTIKNGCIRSTATADDMIGAPLIENEQAITEKERPFLYDVETSLTMDEMNPDYFQGKRRSLRYVGDFKSGELSPEEMKIGWTIAQKQIEKQRKVIRNQNQKMKRFQRKQASMKIVLKELRRKGIISDISLKTFLQSCTSAEVDDPAIPPACGPSADDAQQASPNSPREVHSLSDEDHSTIQSDVAANISSGVRSRNVHENLDESNSRKRPACNLDEVRDRMDYAFNCLKSLTEKPKSDECSLYVELFEKKLRALNQSNREIAMNEINNLLFRLKRHQENPLAFLFNQNSFTPNGVTVVPMMSSSTAQQPISNIFLQPASSANVFQPRISLSSTSSLQCDISNIPSVEMTFEAETPLEQKEPILKIKQEPLELPKTYIKQEK